MQRLRAFGCSDYLQLVSVMRTSSSLVNARVPRRAVSIASALAALCLVSALAHADDDPDTITITAPSVKVIGRDAVTNAPIEETIVSVRVHFDPVTLTTNSGVSLLKDDVYDAARKACRAATLDDVPSSDGDCVRVAVDSAMPQVNAAIARARAGDSSASN
jgi:UrcA family protein